MQKDFKRTYTVIVGVLIILVYMQIFRFSGMTAEVSTEVSMSVTEQLVNMLEALFPIDLPFNDSPQQIDQMDGFVRKAAHFSEYALLGVLTYSLAICWNKKNKKGTACSFLFVVILAAGDEFHQYFVPGRSCSLRDVCIDSAGCVIGMLLLSFFYGRYNQKRLKAGRRSE